MLKCFVFVLFAVTIVFCAPGFENSREKESTPQDVTDQLNVVSRTRRQSSATVDIVYIDTASIDSTKLTDLQSKESPHLAPVNVVTKAGKNHQQLSDSNLELVSQNSNYAVYKLNNVGDSSIPLNGFPDDKKSQTSDNQYYDYNSEQYEGYSIREPPPRPPPPHHHPHPPPPEHHPPPPPPDHHPPSHHHPHPPPPSRYPPPPHHHHPPPPPPPDDYRSNYYDRYYKRPPPPPSSSYDDRSRKFYDDRQTRQSPYGGPPPPPHRDGPPHGGPPSRHGPPHHHGGPPDRFDDRPPPHHHGPPPHHGGPPDRFDDRPPPHHHGPPNRYDDRPPPHHGGPPDHYDDRHPPPYDRPPYDRGPPPPPNDRRPPPDREQMTYDENSTKFIDTTQTSSTTEAGTDDQYQLDVRFNDDVPEVVETMKRDVTVTTARPLSPFIFQAAAVTPEN